jgi:hypothetical protein
LELVNGSRLVALPGDARTVRSFSGVSLAVIDEAALCPDDLLAAVSPMLAVSGGDLACASTPFGVRGFFHSQWEDPGSAWERVRVPASACPRISPAFLESERRQLGERWYSQEYEVAFVAVADSVFDPDAVRAALDAGVRPLFPALLAGGNAA